MKPTDWTPVRIEAQARRLNTNTIRSRYDQIDEEARQAMTQAELFKILFSPAKSRKFAGKTAKQWAAAINRKYGREMSRENVYQNLRKWVSQGFTEREAIEKLDELVRRRIRSEKRRLSELKEEQ